MRELVLAVEAEDELLQSARYYEQERRGLGDDFLAEVRALAGRLLEFPNLGTVVLRDIRRARVHRFPYDLVYRVRDNSLLVVAVMHQRRKPDYWKSRI